MIRNYYEVRDWLESFIPEVYGKEELGLLRIEHLLKLLGNPEKKFKSIHVAGTSGKGTTCFYISKLISQNLKLKVGLHTSPHLVDIRERMQIFQTQNSKLKTQNLISMGQFLKLFDEIKPVVDAIQKEKPQLTPSYFEILVAVTFLYFAKEKVDFAVVEVGLGGRLDATNVLLPEVCVITNIGLDHTEILGDTVEEIAWEKAGIIKSGVPIITGASGEALNIIEKVAKEKGSKLININTQGVPIELQGQPFSQGILLAQEAVKTILATSDLSFPRKRESRNWILDQVENDTKGLPGRLEKIEKNVILDGAHNPQKIEFLINFLRKSKVNGMVLVIGFKKGKDWKKMVDLLISNFKCQMSNVKCQISIIATKYQAVTDTGRGSAVDPEEILRYVNGKYTVPCGPRSAKQNCGPWKLVNGKSIGNSQEAVWEALQRTGVKLKHPEGVKVLVTGSLYLVGEARTLWKLPSFT